MAMAVACAAATHHHTFLPHDNNFPSSSSCLSPPFLLFSPTIRTTRTATTILCSKSPPPPQSLSEQLLPLSLTLLKTQDHHHHPLPPPNPKPTWVNPTKRKPSVLTPHRHHRPPFSPNPDLAHFSLLARRLSSLPDSDFSAALAAADLTALSRDSALLLLNSLRPSCSKSLLFLSWLKSTHHSQFPIDTIFYNVALKSLRLARNYDLSDSLAADMLAAAVPLDNITYSTLITCAKTCRRFDRALHWFDHMYKSGVVPDEITYSAVLDVFAKLGKFQEAVALYERARAGGWTPDAVAFSVLAKMFGETGDLDGIRYVLEEIKAVGLKPNLVVYNTLIKAAGKAGRPGIARSLFDEMLSSGLSPNEKTLTALIKIYGKARWGRDALELWERMRMNNWPMDFILYNTLLSMCADLGMESEAERLFEEMKTLERDERKPDSWSYTAMINIYASGGKPDLALAMFEEMLKSGVEPNVMSCTCLIQCLGKARRIRDAVDVFDVAMEKGIKADDRLCGCLLSVLALCEEGEMGEVLSRLKKAKPRLAEFVLMLDEDEVIFDELKVDFRDILNGTTVHSRRPFCNCLIDVCRKPQFPLRRAHELFQLGSLYGLYPGLDSRSMKEWSLNLRSLSVGAAITAFDEWIRSVSGSIEKKEVLPQEFLVHAGSGTHKFSQGLASSVSSHLMKLGAPFEPSKEKGGSFVASRENLISWVRSRAASETALAA